MLRQSTVLPPEPSPMPARVDNKCLRLTGNGAIDGSTHSLSLGYETRQGARCGAPNVALIQYHAISKTVI